jgi:hypothetical protein
MTLNAPTTPTRRDRWGRYQVVNPTTGKLTGYTRATTVAKALDDGSGLIGWSKRMVALGLAQRADLLALVATSNGDKRTLDSVCERAAEAGGSTIRRDLGTAVHAMLEQSWSDTTYTAPAPYTADIKAVHAALDAHGITVEAGMVERIVVNDTHQIAGTFDLLVRSADGKLRVADIKTGSSLMGALSFAIQLAIYANADALYTQGPAADGSADIREPMPEIATDYGYIFHVQPESGHCDVHTIDLIAGAEALKIAMAVREARKVKVLTPAPIPEAVMTEAIEKVQRVFPGGELVTHVDDDWRRWMTSRIQAIKDAGAIEALALHWPAVPTIPSGEQITIDQGAEIEAAVALIEQQYELPFPAPRTQAAVTDTPKPQAAKRRPRPEEGPDVDAEMVAAVNERAKQLEPDAIAWVGATITAASKANYPIRLSGAGGKKTLRRWYIANALVTLGGFADEALTRSIVSLAISEELQPGHNIAAAIGSLTIEEAQRLMRLTAAVADSSLVPIWGEDSVTLTGDIQAALAA